MAFLSLFSVEVWILLITFICAFVVYGYWTHGVFEKLGVPGPKPRMYLGTVGQHHHVYYKDDLACAQKYKRVWGMYELRTPLLFVMDADMLKTILVKECFTYFTNRRDLRLNGDLYDSVSIITDDNWRRIRNSLTPSFTTGRIKEMFQVLKYHSRKLVDKLQSTAENNEVFVVKDLFGCYSMDSMMGCAFSVDMDTINDPSGPIITHAAKVFNIPLKLFLFQGMFPFFIPLLDLLGFALLSRSATNYFKTIVRKIKAERSQSSYQNSDVFQHMINSPKKDQENKGLTDHEVITQAAMFAFAGYETSNCALTFLMYNLAIHPEVMKRLQKEIDSTFPNKASVQYEDLLQMEYLDSVVNESLRLYPPATRLERVAKETVKVNGVTIPKDMIVTIPVYALHRDPELWPEPEEFRPERFSKENKQNINPYTYLPFGAGPRNCLGMRLALLLVKLAVVEVLQNFSFSVCEETEIPVELGPQAILGPLRPIKLKVVTRSAASEDRN